MFKLWKKKKQPLSKWLFIVLSPQTDITPTEVMEITIGLTCTRKGVHILSETWDDMKPEIKRHFSLVEGK